MGACCEKNDGVEGECQSARRIRNPPCCFVENNDEDHSHDIVRSEIKRIYFYSEGEQCGGQRRLNWVWLFG